MEEHPQFEYFDKKRLNPKDAKDRQLFEEYCEKRTGEKVQGKACQDKVFYK